jgi:hypothetical protein
MEATSISQSSGKSAARSAASASRRAALSQPASRRRALNLLGLAGLAAAGLPPSSSALGLESLDLPAFKAEPPEVVRRMQEANRARLEIAEGAFQDSDLLRTLREKSVAGREGRKKDLLEKYCRRQAEYGAGDCAGLRLIPGATKSGLQKRPELPSWLGGGGEAAAE